MTQHDRFSRVQMRATELRADALLLRAEANLPGAASTEARLASFNARRHAHSANERATEALWTLRKDKPLTPRGDLVSLLSQLNLQAAADTGEEQWTEPPVIGDYDRFDERVTGIAGAQGQRCGAIADVILGHAEFILEQGEAALARGKAILATADKPVGGSEPVGPTGSGC